MIQDDLSSTFVDPTLLTDDLDSPTKPSCLGRGVFHTAKGQNSIPGGKGCGLECKPNGTPDIIDIWGDEWNTMEYPSDVVSVDALLDQPIFWKSRPYHSRNIYKLEGTYIRRPV